MSNGETSQEPDLYRGTRGACSGENDAPVLPVQSIELIKGTLGMLVRRVGYQCPAHEVTTDINFSPPLPASPAEVVHRACAGCAHNREVRKPLRWPNIQGG